jgi:Domain of unknown function (DUF303).
MIDKGPMDWQIIQQVNGKADISLSGRWLSVEKLDHPNVLARIVDENTGGTVIPWQSAEHSGDADWQITIKDIPAGGLYRIETCLDPKNNIFTEWAIRGDMIHHIGIGDVFVIAGQSNSVGYGKDPVYDPPEIGVHLLKNSGKWDLASHPMNESTGIIHEENREGANPGHSPYLSFARQLKRELAYPVGLIQTSLGGTPLSAWNPGEDGILYRNMINIISSQGKKIKGVLWYQGCSDAAAGLCDTYMDRFQNMVTHLRKDLGDESLPILTVQLNRCVAPADETADRCWGRIREAQRQAARQIPNVFIIPATDSTLSDASHNSSASNMVLGERLARVALKNIYDRKVICEAPDLVNAEKLGDDMVILAFSNVVDRIYLYEITVDQLPFIIEDEMGAVNIKNYEQKYADSILITMDRKLIGKCQVHGASEKNPRGIIPVDFASHLPILSFYGVEITDISKKND